MADEKEVKSLCLLCFSIFIFDSRNHMYFFPGVTVTKKYFVKYVPELGTHMLCCSSLCKSDYWNDKSLVDALKLQSSNPELQTHIKLPVTLHIIPDPNHIRG